MNDCYVELELTNPCVSLLSEKDAPWIRRHFKIFASIGEKREKVGNMSVMKLSIGEVYRRRSPLWMVFDDVSAEASACYEVVFNKKGEIRRPFQDERYNLREDLFNDFHFLERIEISEQFKGHGIAGVATRIYLENFANGDDVAYLKAFPLQFESRCEDKPYERLFEGDGRACFAKLCKYYEKIGFRRIGRTNHFFFVVDDFLEKSGRG